jgi:hypothetical protein
MSRAIATRLGTALGRNIVVDNRPGASGMIGTEMVAKADPDGHTLLGHTSSYPATAAVRAKLPFDPARSIIPVGMTARAPMLFAIHPSIPAKSVKELIAIVKKDPKKYFLNYGSSGTGGNNHFSGALFASAAGIKMEHVSDAPPRRFTPPFTARFTRSFLLLFDSDKLFLGSIGSCFRLLPFKGPLKLVSHLRLKSNSLEVICRKLT